MRVALAILASAVALGSAAQAQRPDDAPDTLALICWGEGQQQKYENRSGWVWNRDNDRFGSETRLENRTENFSQELLVEINGDHGHIRLAGPLIPPLRSGGRDGWWDLDDLQVTRETITARYRLNGLNKPRLTIDRRIGRIRIDGMVPFSGQCEDATRAAERPRF